MPYWDERVAAMAPSYPGVSVDQYHIDILTAHFVRNPHWFDVVVASNLFGDILSDLGPACTGAIAIAPSGNINRSAIILPCSSRCTARPPTSRVKASPIRSARSGRPP
jgi:isocitrate/isopropylmalate dehydrogenase